MQYDQSLCCPLETSMDPNVSMQSIDSFYHTEQTDRLIYIFSGQRKPEDRFKEMLIKASFEELPQNSFSILSDHILYTNISLTSL